MYLVTLWTTLKVNSIESYCVEVFSKVFSEILEEKGNAEGCKFGKEDYEKLMRVTCTRLNDGLNEDNSVDTLLNGSTGVLILVHQGNIISGNVGDSRAVLLVKPEKQPASVPGKVYLKAKQLSLDMVPELFKERERILKAGGDIRPSFCKPTRF